MNIYTIAIIACIIVAVVLVFRRRIKFSIGNILTVEAENKPTDEENKPTTSQPGIRARNLKAGRNINATEHGQGYIDLDNSTAQGDITLTSGQPSDNNSPKA